MNADAARTLASALAGTAPLWRPVPFHDDPPWVDALPELTSALLALDDTQLAHFETRPDQLQTWIAEQEPTLKTLLTAADACIDNGSAVPQALFVAEKHGRDVPGRKWQQILHFAAAADQARRATHPPDVAISHLVEWCSGKAHLGRLLARLWGAPVTAIEWNADLCEAGRDLAKRDRVPVSFIHADVLTTDASAPAANALSAHCHALALHACGDLHLALLRQAVAGGIPALDIAPCCYHLTREPLWHPLSAALADCALVELQLTRNDLRLAVQETATSSARVIRQQQQLMAWRLGFDALQRELLGRDVYLPTPSRPAHVLAGGFAAFCSDLAQYHQLPLPKCIDLAPFAVRGQQRLLRARRLQLLRHACRRPLEILLVADRALVLTEAGYQVTVQPFCPRALTPRNLLIQARRYTN